MLAPPLRDGSVPIYTPGCAVIITSTFFTPNGSGLARKSGGETSPPTRGFQPTLPGMGRSRLTLEPGSAAPSRGPRFCFQCVPINTHLCTLLHTHTHRHMDSYCTDILSLSHTHSLTHETDTHAMQTYTFTYTTRHTHIVTCTQPYPQPHTHTYLCRQTPCRRTHTYMHADTHPQTSPAQETNKNTAFCPDRCGSFGWNIVPQSERSPI